MISAARLNDLCADLHRREYQQGDILQIGEVEVEIVRKDPGEIAFIARSPEAQHIVQNNHEIKLLPKQPKGDILLKVWSKTHYGRGTPPTEEENKISVMKAVDKLSRLGITHVQACFDEDYGWCARVTQDYIDNLPYKINSSNEITDFDEVLAHCGETDQVLEGELEVSFSALWKDWKDNYGA